MACIVPVMLWQYALPHADAEHPANPSPPLNKSFVARYTAAIVHPAPAVIARPLHDGYHSHDVCDLMLTPCLIWRRSVLFQAS